MNRWTIAALCFTAIWMVVVWIGFGLFAIGHLRMDEYFIWLAACFLGVNVTSIPCGHMGHRAMARSEQQTEHTAG